jgi:DNA-binding IclR family transcriptional regulator
MPRTAGTAPKLVGALTSGLSVLRYLSHSSGPVGVTRVARDLALNASTCFNLLRTLVHEGLVKFDEATKTYTIGIGVIELARGALDRASFVRMIQPYLEDLAARHSVTVVTWQKMSSDRLILVHMAENPAAIRVQMSVGTRIPLHAGASGRCMAAFGGATRAQVKAGFAGLHWDRVPSFDAYWKSVLDTRAQGYAIDEGTYARGVTVLAAPVFDASGLPVMTIGAAGFTEQLDARRKKALVADLLALAARASRASAGTTDDPTRAAAAPAPP